MPLHVIVGAGSIGTSLGLRLADAGHEVRVVTRSGRAPSHPAITAVAADASDPDALRSVAAGAATLYNCANPPTYMDWERQWPPLAASLLRTAEETGAVLATMSNVYGYGPTDVPMTRDHPLAATSHKGRLRARMWRDALAAHEAGRVRVTEVRASDYIGPTIGPAGGLVARYALAVLAGKSAGVFGDPDAPHTWAYVPDVAATLAVVGADERAWGQAWHVPSNPAVSVRDVLGEVARRADASAPKIRKMPNVLVKALKPVVPIMRELDEVVYQFQRPFVVDAEATTSTFGLRATPWNDVLTDTVGGWKRLSDQHDSPNGAMKG